MVLPSELRKRFRIHEGDHLAIHVEEERIVLTKVETGCVFCDSTDGLVNYRDKLICERLRSRHRRSESRPRRLPREVARS